MAEQLTQYLSLIGQSGDFDKAVDRILLTEANALHACLDRQIAYFYSSYDPIEYKRTWKFRDSVRIDRHVRSAEGGGYSMRVYFDEGASTHPSIIDPRHADGFVPILWNEGWAWADTTVNIYRFSHYPKRGKISGFKSEERLRFVEAAIFRYFKERGSQALPILKVVTYGGTEERKLFQPKKVKV